MCAAAAMVSLQQRLFSARRKIRAWQLLSRGALPAKQGKPGRGWRVAAGRRPKTRAHSAPIAPWGLGCCADHAMQHAGSGSFGKRAQKKRAPFSFRGHAPALLLSFRSLHLHCGVARTNANSSKERGRHELAQHGTTGAVNSGLGPTVPQCPQSFHRRSASAPPHSACAAPGPPSRVRRLQGPEASRWADD